MRMSAALAVFTAALVFIPTTLADQLQIPLTPNTGAASSTAPQTAPAPVASRVPLRVRIPDIGLNSRVQTVEVTLTGDLGVPDGSTKNVGWYAAGTTPGAPGSAVFDAHVFAAFKKLRYALPGADIYVDMSDGKTLHFKIQESTVYALDEVPLDKLFTRNDIARLNLITCAGKLTRDRSTYDHRLVDYAVLVE